MDLHIRQNLTKARDHKDPGALKIAYGMIKDGTTDKTASDSRCFCPELYVLCAEEAVQLGCAEMAEDCLMMYFEGKPPANHFLCRAYLCQGQLNSPQTTGRVEDMEKAVMYFLKAIEISKEKQRYHFLVFNASVLYLQAVRPFLRPGLRQHLASSLAQVLRALEEVGEPDSSWMAQLMLHLVECLVDAGKGKEAANFAKVASDFIESHKPDLYPKIFSLQVRHKLLDISKTPKKSSSILSVIYKMQKLQHEMERGEARKDDAAKLKEIFLLLTPSLQPLSPATAPPSSIPGTEILLPIPPADRIEFLLELGLLSLQLKQPQLAADCLRELTAADVSRAGQRVMMECLQCELDLHKHEGRIEDYSKGSVEAQLRVVGRLDVLLQGAVREGDARVVQAVCATQWNTCLLLLQHNLRQSVKTPLLRVARALEDTDSMLLELRCQLHAELAAMEEQEERLELALGHLHKALRLDERGAHRERLSTTLHLLQLRATLYQTPTRSEDQAAMLIQQAKGGSAREEVKKRRPMLVSAGIALAPDAFQTVLDADSKAKVPSGSGGQGPVALLAAKARHHAACVEKAEGHLTRQGHGTNHAERARLWASLAKVARKQEVWDVCRAACRFSLLYDDGRWKVPRNECERKDDGSPVDGHHGDGHLSPGRPAQCMERELLRLLAEVHFINAEATIHKLRSEGVELNEPAVPPEGRGTRPPEDDPQWVLYSEWVQELSGYAMAGFLRGAALGAELREAWLVANAAVYVWNYSSGGRPSLLPTLTTLVELLRHTGHAGEAVLMVLLCDAVAQGIIQPWCVTTGRANQDRQDSGKGGAQPAAERKKGAGKTGSIHGLPLDPASLQDIRKALELCDYALHLSNGNGESVPIAARKQVLVTWVHTKRLLQQQIGQKLDIDDESKNEAVTAMTRVLVGVEMLLCNSDPGLMEFTVPSLSVLVRMASDCKWSDPVVELHAWVQLAQFAHQTPDQDLVMTCSHNALLLEPSAVQRAKVAPCALYSVSAVQEMLSSVACLRGLSMLHKSSGHPHSYRAALHMLQSSVSYAECAGSAALCMAAAQHYWNACLPLLDTPGERQQLREPLEKILQAMAHTSAKQPADKGEKAVGLTEASAVALTSSLEASSVGSPENDLALRAAMFGLLFHVHADRRDWRSALQLLERAIREMPRTAHRLLLFKQRVLVRARLGESVLMDMQKFRDEGEACSSHMWHQVALCAGDLMQQLACYQNAITALQSEWGQWQKQEYLQEFGQWLYCSHFPLADAWKQLQWAVDILLHTGTEQQESAEKSGSKGSKLREEKLDVSPAEEAAVGSGLIPVKCESRIGLQGVASGLRLAELREVRRLDGLVRAHTLMGVMEGRASPQHQQHLLLAYSCVLRIWQVSMATAHEVIKEMTKNPVPIPPPSAAPKKEKEKENEKEKEKEKGKKSKEPPPAPVEEKPRRKVPENVLPSTPEEWAEYECPEDIRQAFRHDTGPHCVNTTSLSMQQSRTLFFLELLVKELQSLSLPHLALPPLHLAEVIAHDLCNNQSLSDLYRLRIVKSCCELGLESAAAYRDKLQSLTCIHEEELMGCRKAVALQRERNNFETGPDGDDKPPPVVDPCGLAVRRWSGPRAQDVWLQKAEMCLSMGLYQPARQLLAETHLVAKELGDRTALAKSLHLLAVLANQELNHGQALALLQQAQPIGGDEDFWYQLTLTLLKATAERGGPDTESQVCEITERACSALRLAVEQRPNRAPLLRSLIASLETEGAAVRLGLLRPAPPGVPLTTRCVRTLTGGCDTLRRSANELMQLGYREQAAEAVLQHAQALRVLATHTDNTEEKRRHLLECFGLMQQAVSIQEEVLSNALSLSPPQQSRPLSLPAGRVLVRLRLALADVALLLLDLLCAEEKTRALAQDRKPSVERTVEEYVRSTTDLSPVEREWLSMCQTVGQLCLSQLSVVATLSADCVETRARALSMLGNCLRLLALQEDPLHPSTLWDGLITDEARMELKACPEDEEKEFPRASGAERRQYAAKCAELQRRRGVAQQLLAQASETLAQAISLALQHRLPHILSDACRGMLECYGQLDPSASGQYLALFQSCCCCALMGTTLLSACSETSECQLAALLGLQRQLLSAREPTPSSLLTGLDRSLTCLSQAYCQLTVSPAHLSILGELPSNLKILLLQHADDGSVLYGAFYEKTKLTESQKGKNMPAAGTLACSRVAKASVHPGRLLQLQDQARAFRHLTARTLLKETRRHDNGAGGGHHTYPKTNTEVDLDACFTAMVEEMEDYLHPVLSQLDFSCLRLRTPSIPIAEPARPKEKEEKAATDKGPSGSPAELGECVVLLADRALMELPLEALAVLQAAGISSLSRDFSLQLLHTRLQRDEPVESDSKKETKGGKGAKGKGDQGKVIKVVPVSRVVPPNTLPVDTHNFKYIVDPHNEAGESEWSSPTVRMRRTLETYGQQFTPFWEGILGSERTLSLAHLEHLLTSCSAFIFYGTERFLANIPPSKLATLHLSECQIAIIFDLVQNSASMLRQSKLDVQKSVSELALEAPVEAALLLSLSGVRSVLLNQWHSTAQRNAHNMEAVMDNLLKMGLTTGQTVHALRMDGIPSAEREENTSPLKEDAVSPADAGWNRVHLPPSSLNFIIYGLPNLVIT